MSISGTSRKSVNLTVPDEIKRGDAHAFFVNYTKWQTIDERERILKESQQKQAAFVATLPEAVREDSRDVGRRMMKVRIEKRQKHGKWDDQWVVHPFPTVDEPHKAVCWLTRHEAVDEDHEADLYLRSGLWGANSNSTYNCCRIAIRTPQVQPLHNIHHKPRQMIVRQPMPDRRRQKVERVSIHSAKLRRHQPIVHQQRERHFTWIVKSDRLLADEPPMTWDDSGRWPHPTKAVAWCGSMVPQPVRWRWQTGVPGLSRLRRELPEYRSTRGIHHKLASAPAIAVASKSRQRARWPPLPLSLPVASRNVSWRPSMPTAVRPRHASPAFGYGAEPESVPPTENATIVY